MRNSPLWHLWLDDVKDVWVHDTSVVVNTTMQLQLFNKTIGLLFIVYLLFIIQAYQHSRSTQTVLMCVVLTYS
jgi:hypothetical protein